MNPKNTSIGCIENQVQQINVADKNVLFGVKSQQMLAKMSISARRICVGRYALTEKSVCIVIISYNLL